MSVDDLEELEDPLQVSLGQDVCLCDHLIHLLLEPVFDIFDRLGWRVFKVKLARSKVDVWRRVNLATLLPDGVDA